MQVKDMASKFDNHMDEVVEWRREGLTWGRISNLLQEKGISCTRAQVYEWYMRRQKRAEKIAVEIAPFDKLKKPKIAVEIPDQTEIPASQYTEIKNPPAENYLHQDTPGASNNLSWMEFEDVLQMDDGALGNQLMNEAPKADGHGEYDIFSNNEF